MNEIEIENEVKVMRIDLREPRRIKIIGEKKNGKLREYEIRVSKQEKLCLN